MKNRRHRAKSDIVIDLTSLLDVIFLVLLVVLAKQQTLVSEAEAKESQVSIALEEAMQVEQDAQSMYELYMDQVDFAENINQYVYAVSVNATYNTEKVDYRKIRVLREGKEVKTVDLRGVNVQDSYDEFKAYLEEYVKEHPSQPVILSLNEDDEKILYRDEKAIKEIFEDLKDAYDNVFVR